MPHQRRHQVRRLPAERPLQFQSGDADAARDGGQTHRELPDGRRLFGSRRGTEGDPHQSVCNVAFHLNAAYEFYSGTSGGEENGRWKAAFGPSIPLGAPHSTRMTLITDIFAEEGTLRGSTERLGAEVGVRYQLTERTVLDAGVGTEFAGDDRSPIFATVGVSYSF